MNLEREYLLNAQVDKVYTVQNKYGEVDDTPIYSIEEAIDYLQDIFGTKTGKILDAHTGEVVACVVKGKLLSGDKQ